ncbi:MAG TPA: hypothetical protein VNN09_14925 [Candidatus Competibacteraceae bacterium]|nr:hypothetical protein [Candidatus Competibacteraceae bacterium]
MLACLPRFATPCLLFALSLSGCASVAAVDSTRYFPLASGLQWRYQVSRTDRPGLFTDLTVASLATELHDGQPLQIRRGSSGREYLFGRDDWGIYRAGWREAADFELRWEEARRYVLPDPLTPRQQWRRAPAISGELLYTVESLEDTVRVPAGAFRRCLRVRGTGVLPAPAGPVEVLTQEWYAPGIGLIKLRRRERAHTTTPSEMLIELVEFKS